MATPRPAPHREPLDWRGPDDEPAAREGRALDAADLERIAVAHLSRWPAPPAHLRAVLMRRVDKTLAGVADGSERRAELAALVTRVVAELVRRGLVDETAYAQDRVAQLRARGDSAARIRAKLAAKGVSRDQVDEHLDAETAADGPDPEWLAAVRLARRRGLGPFRRDPEDRAARRDKDLSALGRAGFAFDVARRIVDAEPEELDPAADR